MAWLILTIILGIVAIGGFVVGAGSATGEPSRIGGFVTGGLAVAAWLILTLFLCIHTVGQTDTGVVYSFSGTISGDRSPGVVFTAPWQHIVTESTAVTKDTFDFEGSNTAVSKDQQPIDAELVVNYQVDSADVVELLKEVGTNWVNTLLDGRVQQDFKETTAKFTSPEITLDRSVLHEDVLARLSKELCPDTKSQPWCVHVIDVFISNVGYSQSYTNAIEAKQVQVQQAEQAEAKVAQAKAEAQQNVALAEGAAQSTLVKAEAEAKSLAVKGKAIRQNPEVLQLETIDKLSPNVQVIYCTGSGEGNCPSFLQSNTPPKK